ncbi:putative methyltransferase-domain-containing protein [Cladochytrium replicatum]|nr:putative methyltransferase-domain-containing protein [Cladochytrium replicatum]
MMAPVVTDVTATTTEKLAWRRNFLNTNARFASPLYISFSHAQHSTVRISSSPVTSDSQYETSLSIVQSLDTVNCLWDACTVLSGCLFSRPQNILGRISSPNQSHLRILEIGSGCGALSIVVSKALGRALREAENSTMIENLEIVVTEMEGELDLLDTNMRRNFVWDDGRSGFTEGSRSIVKVRALDWGSSHHWDTLLAEFETTPNKRVDLIIATDVVYEIQAFDHLLSTITSIARSNGSSSPTLFLMGMERRWKDVMGFWWEEVQAAGWTWEVEPRDSDRTKREWWEEVEEIEIFWLRWDPQS